jgi:hypothetical protein
MAVLFLADLRVDVSGCFTCAATGTNNADRATAMNDARLTWVSPSALSPSPDSEPFEASSYARNHTVAVVTARASPSRVTRRRPARSSIVRPPKKLQLDDLGLPRVELRQIG